VLLINRPTVAHLQGLQLDSILGDYPCNSDSSLLTPLSLAIVSTRLMISGFVSLSHHFDLKSATDRAVEAPTGLPFFTLLPKISGMSLGPLIRAQRLPIRTSQSTELNLTPVLRNIKLLILDRGRGTPPN